MRKRSGHIVGACGTRGRSLPPGSVRFNSGSTVGPGPARHAIINCQGRLVSEPQAMSNL